MTVDGGDSGTPSCPDDAAYLVGALDAEQRQAYERHLADCARCQATVASMTPTITALRRLPADRALGMLDEPEGRPGDRDDRSGPRDGVVSMAVARVRRRRRRRVAVAMVSAAAVGALVATAVVRSTLEAPAPVEMAAARPVAMEAVVDDPGLSAAAVVTPAGVGTAVSVACRYADEPPAGQSASNRYAMYVTAVDGTRTRLVSWIGTAGTAIRPEGTTPLPVDEIATVSVVMEANDLVLLQGDLDADA